MSKHNKDKKLAPRPKPKPPAFEMPASKEASTERTRNPGVKMKPVKKRAGGTFDMEIKIPKEMVTQGIMYGYKKGGQV